jgi:hypothetical protein
MTSVIDRPGITLNNEPLILGEKMSVNNMSTFNFKATYSQIIGWLTALGMILAIFGCATTSHSNIPAQNRTKSLEAENGAALKPSEEKTAAEKSPAVTPPKSIAAWIPKGSGAFTIDAQRMFHGIGGSTSSSNPILLRASADNRSREELALILTRFISFVTNTYWNKDGGRESSDVGNLQLLNDTFAAAARDALSKSRISGHWQDPKSGEFYSLCRLPLSDLITAMAGDTRLDRRSRDYFLKNAEKLYDLFSRGKVEPS